MTTQIPQSSLTILQCTGDYRACKVFTSAPDGTVVEKSSYDAGFEFRFIHPTTVGLPDKLRVLSAPTNIREWLTFLRELEDEPQLFIVRGEPIALPTMQDTKRRLLKAKKGHLPTLRPLPRNWPVFDFDSVVEPGLSMDDPEHAVRSLIDKYIPELSDTTVCYRPSASAGVKSGLRLHVVACTDKAHDDSYFAAFLNDVNHRAGRRIVDPSLAVTNAPFYTAKPIFEDGSVDPLPERSWKLLGA